MINFDGADLQKEFNEVFGEFSIEVYMKNSDGSLQDFPTKIYLQLNELNVRQLWWLVKFAKHIRGRCRNNSAFNNYMNRNFSPARFKEVPKSYEKNGLYKDYMGLEITKDGETISDNDSLENHENLEN